MTFKILTDDTLKVIHRSNVRSALNPHAKNLRLDPLEPGDFATPIIKSRHDSADEVSTVACFFEYQSIGV
jgi:hypothetical protein